MQHYTTVAAMFAALAASGPAAALTTIVTVSTSATATPFTTVLSLAQFDVAGQVLESFTIDLLVRLTGSAGVENLTGSAKGPYNIDLSVATTLTRAGVSLLANATSPTQTIASLARYDRVSDFAGTSGSTITGFSGSGSASQLITADLAPYTGSGTVAFTVDGTGTSTITGSGLGTFLSLVQTFVDATVTLTYVSRDFVPPPPSEVPEPASWLMMIAGFGAIGGGLRRRRASLAAV